MYKESACQKVCKQVRNDIKVKVAYKARSVHLFTLHCTVVWKKNVGMDDHYSSSLRSLHALNHMATRRICKSSCFVTMMRSKSLAVQIYGNSSLAAVRLQSLQLRPASGLLLNHRNWSGVWKEWLWIAESHSDPETEFISNSELSQLDDFLSSLGETPQLSEPQHSISELPAHSANDTELHQILVR